MGASDIKAGQAYVELALKNNLTKPLAAAGKQLRSFGAGIAAGGTAILAPFIKGIQHFAAFGSELKDMSTRTGIGATALAELGYAAEQTGASMEEVEGGVRKMQKFIQSAVDGSHEARTELASLGLSMAQLQGKKPDEQFQLIADKIALIADPTKRAAAAMKLLGRGGTQLLPMIMEMKELRQKARDLGLAPSEAAVEAADKVGDAMKDVESATDAVMFEIGAAVAGPVLAALKGITKIITTTREWIEDNQAVVRSIAAVGLAAR
jgi:hypothetical protein